MSGNVADATDEGKATFFNRLKVGLSRTRNSLSEGVQQLFLGQKEIDGELLEELETVLLTSDVGALATQQILDHLHRYPDF